MPPSAQATFTTQTRHVPYLTNDQYKRAPTPIPWDTLVPNGTVAECEDQLTQLIERASNWVDSICMQVLAATVDTEQTIAYPNRRAQIIVHPRYQPVIEVTDFWCGTSVATLAQLPSLAGCWVEPKRIVVTQPGIPVFSSAGPIQFGAGPGPAGVPTFVRYSYVNGYPVTVLAAAADQGAQQIQVQDATGVLAGFTPLTIRDAHSEPLTVTAVDGDVLSLAAPLAAPHAAGASVSGLPADVEEAVILAVTGFAKARGNMAIVAQATQGRQINDPLGAGNDLTVAEQILDRGDYIRAAS